MTLDDTMRPIWPPTSWYGLWTVRLLPRFRGRVKIDLQDIPWTPQKDPKKIIKSPIKSIKPYTNIPWNPIRPGFGDHHCRSRGWKRGWLRFLPYSLGIGGWWLLAFQRAVYTVFVYMIIYIYKYIYIIYIHVLHLHAYGMCRCIVYVYNMCIYIYCMTYEKTMTCLQQGSRERPVGDHRLAEEIFGLWGFPGKSAEING